MDHAAIMREIDRVRCLVHQAFGVGSQSAAAGIALYRAALADKLAMEESGQEQK